MSTAQLPRHAPRFPRRDYTIAEPESPSDLPIMHELYLYGATMLAVQVWERSLQTLWQTTAHGLHAQTSGHVVEPGPRTERLTAKQMADDLDERFHDKELLREVTELVLVQDLLAHRYLCLRDARIGAATRFDATVKTELVTLGLRFIKSERRIRDAYGDLPAVVQIESLVEGVERTFRPIARAILDSAVPAA